jgi:1-aminocyclopropane-1-carboxylate deaminase
MAHQLKFNVPSPIEEVQNHGLHFHIDVKREDLIHPIISGNKFRKLKYNLEHYKANAYEGIISFGGAFSNHLHALAYMCDHENIPFVTIIRGEEKVENRTIDFLKKCNATIHYVTRSAYKEKEQAPEIKNILSVYKNYFIIPEGGSNELGLQGTFEILDEIKTSYDYIVLAAGTGYTAAGILKSIINYKLSTKLVVISTLKGDFLQKDICNLIKCESKDFIFTDEYCLGGYGKTTKSYLEMLQEFEQHTNVPVDPIYNGKVIYGLSRLNKSGFIKSEEKVLWINTGGLQGKVY